MSRLLPHRLESTSEESATTEPASASEGWTLEAMPPEGRARMPELAVCARRPDQVLGRTVNHPYHKTILDEFAQRVGNLGEEYGHEDLIRWSSQLSRQAVGFRRGRHEGDPKRISRPSPTDRGDRRLGRKPRKASAY